MRNYIERHRHPVNQWLHAIGVPLTFVVSPAVFFLNEELLAACSFVAGYALQFIGHAIEGNDAGELIVIKKFMGMRYTEFGRHRRDESDREDKKRAA